MSASDSSQVEKSASLDDDVWDDMVRAFDSTVSECFDFRWDQWWTLNGDARRSNRTAPTTMAGGPDGAPSSKGDKHCLVEIDSLA